MRQTTIRFIPPILILALAFAACFPASAQEYRNPPVKVQIPLFLKVLAFETRISSQSDLTVYVVGSSEFAEELRKSIGEPVGKTKLSEVKDGPGLPSDKPEVIYVGNTSKLGEIVDYTKKNKVLSITGLPGLVAQGVTLGIGVLDDKPKILLNISSSKAEGAEWNPAIMKVCTIVGQ